jgi:dihydroorotate dehydrogenase
MFPLLDPRENYAAYLAKLPQRAQKMRDELRLKPSYFRPSPKHWRRIFDHDVASPIGLSACSISLGEGARLSAEMGFDVVTYKTIRSQQHTAYSPPNLIPVSSQGCLSNGSSDISIVPETWPNTASMDRQWDAAMANSIGMPCASLDWVMADIERTRRSLSQGQLLIVSVLGEDQRSIGIKRENRVQDFIGMARRAQEAGAHVIELNLSCPNVGANPQALYKDLDILECLLTPIMKALKNSPVSVKLGVCQGEHLYGVMKILARLGCQGIACMNSLPRKVRTEAGYPAFGSPDRLTAGISGSPLRPLALHFAREASAFNQSQGLGLTILATGGVMHPSHLQDLLDAGADIALTATGAIFDPWLAYKFHQNTYNKTPLKEELFS